MLLIVGLGNHGAQYQENRHNIGFMAVDALHKDYDFSPWNKKFQALIANGSINDEKVILLKPQTFMNLSGQAVGEAMRFYKLQLKDLIVLHDELDIAAGKTRIKIGGGSGGHNGIKSIDSHCGKDYKRIRLGIGHPGDKNLVHNYVLGNFAKSDQAWLDDLLLKLTKNFDLLLKGDDSSFMNKLTNSKPSEKANKATPPKAQSHIHQAQKKPSPKLPETSAPQSSQMAEMLKKLFKK